MTAGLRRRSFTLLLVFALAAFLANIAGAVTFISLHSGNVLPTAPDPFITYTSMVTACGVGFPAPFAAADFAAAVAGPPAISVPNHPAWFAKLPCDPKANWISTSPSWAPFSTLYAQHFTLDECCITHAAIDFCWGVDDAFGDTGFGGPNPMGLYINGIALPLSGGNFSTETSLAGLDITALVHCGDNVMYTYDRDAGCAVSGIIYSAHITVYGCTDGAKTRTWGQVRNTYR